MGVKKKIYEAVKFIAKNPEIPLAFGATLAVHQVYIATGMYSTAYADMLPHALYGFAIARTAQRVGEKLNIKKPINTAISIGVAGIGGAALEVGEAISGVPGVIKGISITANTARDMVSDLIGGTAGSDLKKLKHWMKRREEELFR